MTPLEHFFQSQKLTLHEELSSTIQIVKDEYSKFLETHKSLPFSDYNIDETYKELTKEAIEAKALGIEKIKHYIRYRKDIKLSTGLTAHNNILERIKSTPFQAFSSKSIVLELETGVFGFPWRDIVEQKETIDLGTWCPLSLEPWQLEKVRMTISDHPKWVKAWVHNHLIEFPGGIMAEDMYFEKSLPSMCVTTVALLISVNTNLKRLRIGAQ